MEARAFSPGSVGNVGVGFDILGHSIAGIGDIATVRRIDEPVVRIKAIRGAVTDLPLEAERNTAGGALISLREALALPFGFEIELDKGIPLGSGLGGSAASCVAALVAANALLDAPLDAHALYPHAMAGEAIVKWGTQKTLEASGASIGTNAVVQANDATYSLSADAASYPDAEFVLKVTYSVAPNEGGQIALYARPLDIDGTADAEVPEAGLPVWFVGSFAVNNVTSLQYMTLLATDLPAEAEYYIHNAGAGQTASAGWTLKVKPRTIGPA